MIYCFGLAVEGTKSEWFERPNGGHVNVNLAAQLAEGHEVVLSMMYKYFGADFS